VPVRLDGTCDVTAHVSVDALAARVGGELTSQREVLTGMGIHGTRPSLDMASSDPRGYLHGLSSATEAAELTSSPGLGDHWWLLTPCR
jgi:hypothetical protein